MRKKIFLILILLLGAAVRLWGIDFGLLLGRSGFTILPFVRLDEELVWAVTLRFFTGDLNPHIFIYPTLFLYALLPLFAIYLTTSCFGFYHGSLELLKQGIAMNPSDLILLSRITVASLGTATIYVIYRLARKLFGEGTGLLSAFFLAFTSLHVRDSHFATTDVPLVFMVVMSYCLIAKVFEEGRWRDYLGAGLLAGLSISTKWGAGFLVFGLIAAHFLNGRSGHRKLFCGLLFISVGFLIATPWIILAPGQVLYSIIHELQVQQLKDFHGVYLGKGWLHHLRFSLWYGMGWPLWMAAWLGISFAFRKDWKRTVLLAVYPLTYLFVIGAGNLVFTRYALPLVPFFIIFAAVFVDRLTAFVSRKHFVLISSFLGCLLILPSLYRIYWFDLVMSRQDSRIIAGEWIRQHVEKGLTLSFANRLSEYPTAVSKALMHNRWKWPPVYLPPEPASDYPMRVIDGGIYDPLKPFWKDAPADVIVVDQSPLLQRRQNLILMQDLKKDYDLIQFVQGVGMDTRMIFDQQDGFYVPVAGIQYAKRPGPDFYIFRKKP